MPARSEIIASLVSIQDVDGPHLCEGNDIATSFGLLVGASLNEPKNRKFFVRIANPTSSDILVPKRTSLASIEKVCEFENPNQSSVLHADTEVSDIIHQTKNSEKRFFETKELDIGSSLTPDQKTKLFDLLKSFNDIMSKHESDTGLTDLIEHNINTENLHPSTSDPTDSVFRKDRKFEN